MRAIAVVFFALCLAGCGIAREREQEAQYKAAIDACGQLSAGPVRWAQCQTDAENKYLEALKNSRYSDLLTLKQAKGAEIGSRLERKQITVEQANVELATMNSQIVSEATTRQTAIASASAQQSFTRADWVA